MEDQTDLLSRKIASVLGPVLSVVNVSEALNLGIWAVSVPQVTYLNGMILFAGGLAIVRFHSRWRRDWTVCVTVTGWLMLVAGLFRLFFPTAPQAGASALTFVFIGVLFLLGLVMTIKGYR